jgi:hypothetical protein
MGNYLEFKSEYLRLCEKFGRDTNRKIKNDLKNDAKELQYQIDSIESRLEVKPMVYLYGILHTRGDLYRIKSELEYTNQLLTEIK